MMCIGNISVGHIWSIGYGFTEPDKDRLKQSSCTEQTSSKKFLLSSMKIILKT